MREHIMVKGLLHLSLGDTENAVVGVAQLAKNASLLRQDRVNVGRIHIHLDFETSE